MFSFMSATPMGKAPIIFTLKQYRAFIDQPYLVGIGITSLLICFWTTLFCAVLGFLADIIEGFATVVGNARDKGGRLQIFGLVDQ
ncbi:hypothetical protein ACC772_38930, partial [Rhizobium ruizarguesonis]